MESSTSSLNHACIYISIIIIIINIKIKVIIMTKLCLRERAENGEDGMAKFVLEDPATHLTSVSCDVTMVVTVILMMMVLMSGMIMLFANPRSP